MKLCCCAVLMSFSDMQIYITLCYSVASINQWKPVVIKPDMEQLSGHRTDWSLDKVKLTTCCHVCPVLIPDTGYRLVLVDGFTFVNI